MLIDRIVDAIRFKKGVYASVANDQAFTSNAWLIVMVVAVLNQLGTRAGSVSHGFLRWLTSSVLLGVFAIGGFALAVFMVTWLSRVMFNASVQFEQAARALGLAYIWKVVGFIGILGVVPLLGCVLWPVQVIAWLAGLAADLFAIKESTQMEWMGTIIIAIIAMVVSMVILGIAIFILSVIGLII